LAVAVLPNGLFLPCLALSCVCFEIKFKDMKEKVYNKTLMIKYKLGKK